MSFLNSFFFTFFFLMISTSGFAQNVKLKCAPKTSSNKSCQLKKETPVLIADSAKAIKEVCSKDQLSDDFFVSYKTLLGASGSDFSLEELGEEFEQTQSFMKVLKAEVNKPKNKAQLDLIKKIKKADQDYEAWGKIESKQEEAQKALDKYDDLIDSYASQYGDYMLALIDDPQKNLQELQGQLKHLQNKINVIKKMKTSKGDAQFERKLMQMEADFQVKSVKSRKTFTDCGLTKQELFAINLYTAEYYGPINSALRSKDEEEIAKYKPLIDAINSGLNKIADFDKKVKRGAELPSEIQDKHCLDCEVQYDAYTSSSTNDAFPGNSQFIIQSKKGKYIAPLSAVADEEEVLFPPGTKFKVLEVKDTANKKIFTMVEQ